MPSTPQRQTTAHSPLQAAATTTSMSTLSHDHRPLTVQSTSRRAQPPALGHRLTPLTPQLRSTNRASAADLRLQLSRLPTTCKACHKLPIPGRSTTHRSALPQASDHRLLYLAPRLPPACLTANPSLPTLLLHKRLCSRQAPQLLHLLPILGATRLAALLLAPSSDHSRQEHLPPSALPLVWPAPALPRAPGLLLAVEAIVLAIRVQETLVEPVPQICLLASSSETQH